MTFYKLNPNHTLLKPHHFDIANCDNINVSTPIMSHSLFQHLCTIKEKIEDHQKDWDNIKKLINPYEFVHTAIPNYNKMCIAKYKPLSRSFFKMIEMCNTFDILENYDNPIKTFHMAEGPGGFIEAIVFLRNNTNDVYNGMTLLDDKNEVPGWSKGENFFKKHDNIHLHKGPSENGNLLNLNNFNFCFNNFKNNIDLITGDGGFDFSTDFNKQEITSTKLILAQTIYAITMQKKNGTFILKIFDSYSSAISDIIFLLTCFYKDVFITKPNTSRYANSEKYLVCKHYKYIDISFLNETFKGIIDNVENNNYIKRILNIELPRYFTVKLEEINTIFGQQQIQFIVSTIDMIKRRDKQNKLESIKKNNIKKCIDWCKRNNIDYNNININENIFLKNC